MMEGLKAYPEYRASGVSWLGDVPTNGELRRTKTILREVDRRTTTGAETLLSLRMLAGLVDHHGLGGKLIPAENLIGYKRILAGEIVMNRMRAAAGLFAVASSGGLVSPDYAIFRPTCAMNPAYAVHLFRTPAMMTVFRSESRGLGTGESGFLRLYSDRFGVLPVPFPPLEEQAAIGRFLDHANRQIDSFIRNKRKLIGLLNEQKQAVIHRAVTRGLDAGVAMKDSGVAWLGEVPAHWDVLRSKYVFREVDERSVAGGGTLLSMSQKFGLIPSSDIQEKRLTAESDAGRKVCRQGDIVLNRLKAHLGVFALAPQAGVVSPDYTVLRAAGDVNASYFEAIYRTPACRVVLRQLAKGIVQGFWRLYTDDFYSIHVPVPPLAEQQGIMTALAAALVGLENGIARTNQEIAFLREYRTRLVADVVTGQLDVREAARNLPDLAPDVEAENLDSDAELDEDAAVEEEEEA